MPKRILSVSELGQKILDAIRNKKVKADYLSDPPPPEMQLARSAADETPDKERPRNSNKKNKIRKPNKIAGANKKASAATGDPWQRHQQNYKEERDIVIGFDFGTACSKIVVQDQQLRTAYAVPFDSSLSRVNPYLLPSAVYIKDNGAVSLSPPGQIVKDLKLLFIHDPDQFVKSHPKFTSSALFSSYVALVLNEVRKWFWDNHYANYAHVKIDWQLNIGMPSMSYDDENLYDQIKESALIAWNLALTSDNVVKLTDIEKASRYVDSQPRNSGGQTAIPGQIHPDYISPIPEIIAEVVGFAKSPLRQNGMFLLMDIGASTLDVSSFTIHEKDGDDNYSIWAADVQKLGAYILHQNRIDTCKTLIDENILKLYKRCDGINALPDWGDYIKIFSEVNDDNIIESDNFFLKDCLKVVGSLIRETKRKRNPLASEWKNGLPVFICGGGANIELYNEVVKQINKNIRSGGLAPLQKKGLPKPENLINEDLAPRDFHRVAVSYGLSFDKINIGSITPPRLIADYEINTNTMDIEKRFVDKEMM